MIENLRDQREREDRVRLEEMELMRKENQLLKDKLLALQPQKLSPSQTANPVPTQNQRPDGEVSMDFFDVVMTPKGGILNLQAYFWASNT